MFANIRGTRIYFDVDGMGLVPLDGGMQDRPVAVLVHGGPGADHSNMKATHAPLSEVMQLVFYDQRGHGRSAAEPVENCTMDEAVEDLEALRQHLGLGPIITIGGSYGGMVAMAHAARYPDAVSHLILSATAAHHGLLRRAQEIVAEIGSPDQSAALQGMIGGKLDDDSKVAEYFRVMAPLYSRSFTGTSNASAAGRAIINGEIARRAFGPGGFMQTFDLRGELSNIKAKTLILAGRHDFVCAPEFSDEIAALVLGSELLIFENSSHLIALDEPKSYLDAILTFISKA